MLQLEDDDSFSMGSFVYSRRRTEFLRRRGQRARGRDRESSPRVYICDSVVERWDG